MKKVALIIIAVLCLGFINVYAADSITIPTCKVVVDAKDSKAYKAKITPITANAPTPSIKEFNIKVGEEKNFGILNFERVGIYEYKITLDGADTYYVLTAEITRDGDNLRYQLYTKEKGEGDKKPKAAFVVRPSDDGGDVKPVDPSKDDKGSRETSRRGMINPYTADLIIKFLILLAISAIVFVIVLKRTDKIKKQG